MPRHRQHTTALGRDDGDRFATAVLIGFPVDPHDAVETVGFAHAGPGRRRRGP